MSTYKILIFLRRDSKMYRLPRNVGQISVIDNKDEKKQKIIWW